MDLIKPIEHLTFEGILIQETKSILEQFGGSLIFESVGKGNYQVKINTPKAEVRERIVIKNMPSDIAKKYFLYRIHGLIAKLIGELYPL